MNLKRTLRNGFLASVALLVSAGGVPSYADSLNLVVNGSFESPVAPADSTCGAYLNCVGFHNGVAGNDNIGGWQLIGMGGLDSNWLPISNAPATMLLLGSNYTETNGASGETLYFHSQDGLQSVDLTGEGNQGTTNGIKQSVGTSIGAVYSLTFWFGNQNPEAPGYAGPARLALYINGDAIGSFGGLQSTIDDITWTKHSYPFTASSNQTVIAFLNDTPYGNNYAGLDNVSMLAVPEPASLGLSAIGLALLTMLYLRRNRKLPS